MSENARENVKAQTWVENTIRYEIKACQTALVETLLKTEQLCYDQIQNLYKPVETSGKTYKQLQEELEDNGVDWYESFEDYANDEDEYKFYLGNLLEETNEPQEVYEWWLVSDWLADKLIEVGEPVIKNEFNCSWWGRGCSGQRINLDPTLWDIWKTL